MSSYVRQGVIIAQPPCGHGAFIRRRSLVGTPSIPSSLNRLRNSTLIREIHMFERHNFMLG